MRAILLLVLAIALLAEERAILIAVDGGASAALRAAAATLRDDPPPLLRALQQGQSAGEARLIDAAELLDQRRFERAAYNHLLVIGLPDEPLVERVWGHVQAVDPVRRSVYQQGYGELVGSIGIVDSDRNPFLHSQRIRGSDFETVLVRISGSDEAGVLAAIAAFRQGLLNGLVPTVGWRRGEPTILDLDPALDWPRLPERLAQAQLAGWTQADASEYRALLAAAGHEPLALWRAKYLLPGVFDQVGGAAWKAGLHRKAWGNALAVARFADAAAAQATLEALIHAERLRESDGWWTIDQDTDAVFREPGGQIRLRVLGPLLLLNSLAPSLDAQILKSLD